MRNQQNGKTSRNAAETVWEAFAREAPEEFVEMTTELMEKKKGVEWNAKGFSIADCAFEVGLAMCAACDLPDHFKLSILECYGVHLARDRKDFAAAAKVLGKGLALAKSLTPAEYPSASPRDLPETIEALERQLEACAA
jgi:hypothetical protein